MGFSDRWYRLRTLPERAAARISLLRHDPRLARKLAPAALAVILLGGALALYFVLAEPERRGERFDVPDDDGSITHATTLHERSPLYGAVQAWKRGATRRAADLLATALAAQLSPRERRAALTWLGSIQLELGRPRDAERSFNLSLSIEENAPARYGLGRVHLADGKTAEARAAFEKALARDPKFRRAQLALGELALGAGKPAEAVGRLESFLDGAADADPATGYARALLGDAHLAAGDRTLAARAWRLVLDAGGRPPLTAYAAARLADLADEAGDAARAAELYRQAAERDPGKRAYLYNYGVACVRANRLPDAVAAFRRLLRDAAGAERGVLARTLGEIAYDTSDFDSAAHFFLLAEKDGRDPELAAALGDIFYIQKRWDQAALYYRAVLAAAPRSELAHAALVNLGGIHLARQDYDEAEACYRRALERTPDDARLVFNLGVVLKKRGRSAEAGEKFFAAFALAPAWDKAARAGTQALLAAAKPERARSLLEQALHKRPAAAAVVALELGRVAFALGDLAGAEEAFRRALDADRAAPRRAAARLGLARVALQRGAASAAAVEARAALDLLPGDPAALYLLGLAHAGLARPREAEDDWNAALGGKIGERLAAECLYQLGNLRLAAGRLADALAYFKQALARNSAHFGAGYNASLCVRRLQDGEGIK